MVDPLTAELTLAEVAAARERSRAIQRALAVPLRLAAVADLMGAVVVLIIGREHLLAFFAPAYVVVLVTSWWWYRRYARTHGVWLPMRPWVGILGVQAVVAASLSQWGRAAGNPTLNEIGPSLSGAVALGVTAWWLRSPRLATTASAMVAASVVVGMLAHGDLAVSLQLAIYGLLLTAASLAPREVGGDR